MFYTSLPLLLRAAFDSLSTECCLLVLNSLLLEPIFCRPMSDFEESFVSCPPKCCIGGGNYLSNVSLNASSSILGSSTFKSYELSSMQGFVLHSISQTVRSASSIKSKPRSSKLPLFHSGLNFVLTDSKVFKAKYFISSTISVYTSSFFSSSMHSFRCL